jgi:hypothetical protein
MMRLRNRIEVNLYTNAIETIPETDYDVLTILFVLPTCRNPPNSEILRLLSIPLACMDASLG